MGIWWQMMCVSGSGETHERLKRSCRKEQRPTLKCKRSTANTAAVTRRCFNLMMNSQFVLLQLWKGREKKTLLDMETKMSESKSFGLTSYLPSHDGELCLELERKCKMWTPHHNSNTVYSCIQLRTSWSLGGEVGPHGFLSCKVMSKVLYMGAGHTGHVLLKTIAVKVLTPNIQRCDDWTSVVPLRRNVVSKTQTNSFYTFIITEEWNLRPLPTRGPAMKRPNSQKYNDKFHINDDLPLDALNMRTTTHGSPVIHIMWVCTGSVGLGVVDIAARCQRQHARMSHPDQWQTT